MLQCSTNQTRNRVQSININTLNKMKALTEIQNELKAPKNQYNSFGKYKYRSCEDILEAVKPLLKKHNCSLTLTDEIKEVGGLVFVQAIAGIQENDGTARYVSAQAGIDPNRKGMDIAQSFGSSSSYARKYALNGLFLIDDTKDADATNTHGKQASTPAATPAATPAKQTVNIGDQTYLNIVKAVVDGKGTIEQAKGKYNISREVEDSIKEKVTSLAQL